MTGERLNNLLDLSGKVGVVTGGGRGLGCSIAQGLADLGATAYQEELSIRLLDHETQIHAEVVAALERIEKCTFGICQECGKKIAKLRLTSLPYARRCFVCESNRNSSA